MKGDNSQFIDREINTISHGEYGHVAIKILGGTLEALGVPDSGDKYPGVWLHAADKYDNNPNAEFVEIDLPNLAAAEVEARRLIGTLYGYGDCVRGAIYETTGIRIPGNSITADCSETVTRVVRAGEFSVLPNFYPDDITPNKLHRAIFY
ncbi:MAG: hypothetical protein H6Q69_1533 [Firmicutes bacterium]|nr:hypothetical protein [Bacillota bacterium]